MKKTIDLVTTDREFGEVCDHLRGLNTTVSASTTHIEYSGWASIDWGKAARHPNRELFIISNVGDIPRRAASPPNLGAKPRRHLVIADEGMPVESLPARIQRLNVRDDKKLHLARIHDRTDAKELIERAVLGLVESNHDQRILDAWWESDDTGHAFVVISPKFDSMVIPLSQLSRFIGQDDKAIDTFEIDSEGAFIYWPHADVHLGWRQFEYMIDPTARHAAEREHKGFNQRYGKAIKMLRGERGLRQTDIDGLTDRHVRRIEGGEIRATHAALNRLAAAHDMSLTDYMGAVSRLLPEE